MNYKILLLTLIILIGISNPIVFAEDIDGIYNSIDLNKIDIVEIDNQKYLNTEIEHFYTNQTDKCKIEVVDDDIGLNYGQKELIYNDPLTINPEDINSKNSQRYFTILTQDVQKGSYFQVILKNRTVGSTDGIPLPNQQVTFNIEGVETQTTTDTNGIAKINMTQNAGYHEVHFSNGAYNNVMNVEVFEGNCHFKYQLNELYQTEYFTILLLDENNNPLANKNVYINVNNIIYPRITDAKGMSKLRINLDTGTYVVYYSFAGDTFYSQCSGSTTITVARKNVILTPLTKSVVTHSQKYLVKLTDNSYQPISNASVLISINGDTYTRYTNSDGIAKLNINLNPGYFYSITASYNPQSPTPYNSKTITTSLAVYESNIASTITFSGTYFNKDTFLTVTLKTTGGNVITGRSVDLWINGNIYSNITNNQGNAFFKLNQATGVYGVSAMYASVAHLSSYIYKLIYITDGNMNNDYQTWTDDYNDYQCLNNTLIINLANQLTANCNSDLEKAVAIHSYVSRMNYRLYGNGLNDAYNSLMLFMGNCVDQSNAFMAIAKKAGLIVRGVTGVDSNLINGHAWTQVKIDNKWVVAEITGYNFGCWPGIETYSINRDYFAAFNKEGYKS
ncbi:transglutaminase domain-containing protein [Methanobrevibacter sp.]|uniref:transglutaminase domain-containing protein n=1 Tax=Methanobrevibacter sp. TaxID=66852 RepID=UPI00388D8378